MGPRIKNYMESSVEIQLLQVRLNSFYLYKQDQGVLIYFCTLSPIFPYLSCVCQNLLKRPEVAILVNLRLENTSWSSSRIARFLSTPSPDVPRKPGASSTWLDIYNDLNQTITMLAQVTEVRFHFSLVCFCFLRYILLIGLGFAYMYVLPQTY